MEERNCAGIAFKRPGFEHGLKAAGKDFEFFRYDAPITPSSKSSAWPSMTALPRNSPGDARRRSSTGSCSALGERARQRSGGGLATVGEGRHPPHLRGAGLLGKLLGDAVQPLAPVDLSHHLV